MKKKTPPFRFKEDWPLLLWYGFCLVAGLYLTIEPYGKWTEEGAYVSFAFGVSLLLNPFIVSFLDP